MSIESDFNERLKAAILRRDSREADVIRQIKSEVTLRRTAKGFQGTVDDALYLTAIDAYIKRMTKALELYAGENDKIVAMRAQLEYEIAYLKPLLPSKLDEGATHELVAQTILRLGLTQRKQLGRLMGELMRNHKDQLDAECVRRVAESLLAT